MEFLPAQAGAFVPAEDRGRGRGSEVGVGARGGDNGGRVGQQLREPAARLRGGGHHEPRPASDPEPESQIVEHGLSSGEVGGLVEPRALFLWSPEPVGLLGGVQRWWTPTAERGGDGVEPMRFTLLGGPHLSPECSAAWRRHLWHDAQDIAAIVASASSIERERAARHLYVEALAAVVRSPLLEAGALTRPPLKPPARTVGNDALIAR